MTVDDKALMAQFARIQGVWHRLWHQRAGLMARRFGPTDASRGQGRVLAILKLRPEIAQKDLAYLLDMRSQSLGELLLKLERSGYITRIPSPEDKRRMIVQLTDKGREEAGQLEKQMPQSPFSCLTEEEKAQLAAILDKLLAHTLDNLGEDGRDPHAHGPWEGFEGGGPFGGRGGPGFGHFGGRREREEE